MNVLFVSLYSTAKIVMGKGRVGNFLRYVSPEDKVTVVGSDFNHRAKRYVDCVCEDLHNVCRVTVHVGCYRRNLSIERVLSHLDFARGVRRFLDATDVRFDLIYCIVPSATAALACKRYKSRTGCKMVVDVLDLWPDSLVPICGGARLARLLLRPWSWLSRCGYRMGDYISGESKAYAEVGHRANPDVPYSYTYLGIDRAETLRLAESSQVKVERSRGVINLCYGGSLGNSYDFDAVVEAIAYIQSKGINYKMYFVGGGDREEWLKRQIEEWGLRAVVTGVVPYATYLGYLSGCDIGFNSFRPGTFVVHSYKFNDYVACGLFVMNSLRGETAEMIDRYGIGRNYYEQGLSESLLSVCENWDTIRIGLRDNIDEAIREKLDSKVIYRRLYDDVQKLFASNMD